MSLCYPDSTAHSLVRLLFSLQVLVRTLFFSLDTFAEIWITVFLCILLCSFSVCVFKTNDNQGLSFHNTLNGTQSVSYNKQHPLCQFEAYSWSYSWPSWTVRFHRSLGHEAIHSNTGREFQASAQKNFLAAQWEFRIELLGWSVYIRFPGSEH